MAVLELLVVAVSLLAILLAMALQAAHDLARHQEPLAVQAARPALRVLRALPLLLEVCSGKVVVAVVQVMQAQAVLAVLEVAAQAAVAAVLAVAPMQQALVVSAVMAGH